MKFVNFIALPPPENHVFKMTPPLLNWSSTMTSLYKRGRKRSLSPFSEAVLFNSASAKCLHFQFLCAFWIHLSCGSRRVKPRTARKRLLYHCTSLNVLPCFTCMRRRVFGDDKQKNCSEADKKALI